MRLSRKSDYALRAVRHLSGLPKGKLASISAISEAENVPREFLAKILKDLTRSSLLISYQGVTGGYRLTRAPKDITFLDVCVATDGPIHFSLCTEDPSRCGQVGKCNMKPFWETQEKIFITALGKQRFSKYRMPAKK